MLETSFINRVQHKMLWTLLLPLCMLWPVFYQLSWPAAASEASRNTASELPAQWQGGALGERIVTQQLERVLNAASQAITAARPR